MNPERMRWCFELKTGLSFTDPNENLSTMYEKKSAKAIRLLKTLDEEFDEWIVSAAYYALYHKAYAILLRLGIRSKNHGCTIDLISILLPDARDVLLKYKALREDVQYYGHTRVLRKERILSDLATTFLLLDAFAETLTPSRVQEIRERIRKLLTQDQPRE